MHKYCTLVATQIRWPKEKCKRKLVDFHFQKNCSLRLESWSAPNTELELRWGIDRHKQDSLTDTSSVIDRHQQRDWQTPTKQLDKHNLQFDRQWEIYRHQPRDRQTINGVSVCLYLCWCLPISLQWETPTPLTDRRTDDWTNRHTATYFYHWY